MKKKVRSLMIGPPSAPENCVIVSGISTGLMAERFAGSTQLATEPGQKFFVEKLSACQRPGRNIATASPWRPFVPDFVTTLKAGPDVHPYSAENAFDRIFTSSTALS